MDEDENISMIISMGFTNIDEIKRALRIAKNDVNEAVSILMDQPLTSYGTVDDLSLDYDMKYAGGRSEDSGTDGHGESGGGSTLEFPLSSLYELEGRVFQDNWSIPFKREESLGICLEAAQRLAAEGLLEQDDHCRKFIERVMPEAFRKLLTSNAIHRWSVDIHEGIRLMCELFIEMLATRLRYEPVPCQLLQTLALIFDMKTDWNNKHRDQQPAHSSTEEWEEAKSRGLSSSDKHVGRTVYAEAPDAGNGLYANSRERYGWLCDLINQFGERDGFRVIEEKFGMAENQTARAMSALLLPLSGCASLLVVSECRKYLSPCMDIAFKYAKNISETELKSKDINHLSDLCFSLKVLCRHIWPQHVAECDKVRLEIIHRMLRTPHFNCRMNGLKEVSRLIDEAEQNRTKNAISTEAVLEWMADNKILSVVLEGNIDQVQYTDRIKAIVEFLGPRLSADELTNIWNLGDGENSHVMDNVHGVLAAASGKFSLSQFDLLNRLIREKWQGSGDRIREKLIRLVGQIGKEGVNAKATKPATAILQLLWEFAHWADLPRQLVERALKEHLDTISEINLNKDAIRKQYVLACVDDIKRSTHFVLPAVKHLHDICKSYSGKSLSVYQKASKQTLSDLNKQHEIVKLLTTSLSKMHSQAVLTAGSAGLGSATMLQGRYSHRECVEAHLELMKFLLQEGDLYLSWSRCRELWDTLVDNPNCIQMDRDLIFAWFTKCILDLEPDTQKQLFREKLLNLPAASINAESFACLKAFFESVNTVETGLKKSAGTHLVENIDLIGLPYFWDVLTDATSEEIADRAITQVLNMSYLHVNQRLKKEAVKLHTRFINDCFARLEEAAASPTETGQGCQEAVQEGFELETCASSDLGLPTAVTNATKSLTSISVWKVTPKAPLTKSSRNQKIRRLLLLAERYILSIEVLFNGKRSLLPHAATFYGRPLTIKVRADPKRETFNLESHTNESVGEAKARIAEKLQLSLASLSFISVKQGSSEDEITLESGRGKDARLVFQVGDTEGQTWKVKTSSTGSSSSNTEVVLYEGETSTSQNSGASVVAADSTSRSAGKPEGAGATAAGDGISLSRQAYDMEEEKSLPGVLMATEGRVFSILYQLARTEDPAVLAAIRRLIHLIPTDAEVSESLESVSHVNPPRAANASPKMSPRVKKSLLTPKFTNTKEILEKVLDATAPNMTPFRVLYNLEVLSSRIMPNGSSGKAANKFAEDFVRAGGLRILLNVLEKDALPFDVDYDIRQSAYLIALQLAGYLLCGQTVLHSGGGGDSNLAPPPTSLTPAVASVSLVSSPLTRPTPAKKSALEAVAVTPDTGGGGGGGLAGRSPLALSASKIVQTMTELEFVDLVSCLMRVVWAAAAGKLYLAAMGIQSAPKPERVYIGRRSRDSSTGSSGSLTSDGSTSDQSLHAGVCAQQSTVSSADCQIAGEALELLITCLSLRQNLIARFYELQSVSDFIIDTVLGSPSAAVRQRAVEQFTRLGQIKMIARSLQLHSATSIGTTANTSSEPNGLRPVRDPKYFLIQILLKTPVPLWVPSCKSRNSSHQITSNCGEYLELRCRLLENLSLAEQDLLQASACQMIEDEITWLLTFSPCSRTADAALLAGHIRLVRALLTCEGVSKEEAGSSLIPHLMTTYLFPASKLISDQGLASSARDISPVCDTAETRAAAYELLTELARACLVNMRMVSRSLIDLHHQYDANMIKEHKFEYEPAIDRRAECNYVGLKNAGATCYMNSVIQQLYAVPGVSEQLLAVNLDTIDEETVFFQLQSVFAHLMESKLQYYVPDKFWKCFKLWGQPVNVREQQDACEFFIQIVDQVDEYLQAQNKEKIFSRLFEGVFSDQKICCGCPHRYEREEKFMSLNLDVKPGSLQESLSQYVKGELLEGDNAYFCEKCAQKRNTTKRMCIRRLPSTLVIQLKRFHYDWETNRSMKFDDYFRFPWVLDMGPYTAEGIIAEEDRENFQSKLGPGLELNAANLRRISYNYDLVGVVVHSGQANAGHYYSFIKERKGHAAVNTNKNRWFKFNDTTVEEIAMTDDTLEAECFGGKFKAKKKEGSSSHLPEERQRYWNAYILVYEARADHKAPRTPKKSFSGTTSSYRRSVGPSMQRRLTLPPRISEPGHSENQVRESLSELSELLERGERQGIFSSRMPPVIERAIREDNLRFMQNRDVHSKDYYKFLFSLVTANTTEYRCPDHTKLCLESVNLANHFLFNTYFHMRKRQRHILGDWVDAIQALISEDKSINDWLLHYLATEGSRYLKPFLLECPGRDVRTNFSALLEKVFTAHHNHCTKAKLEESSEDLNSVLKQLVDMLERDIGDNCKHSSQFFWLLSMFAQTSPAHCLQLFQMGAFEASIRFLLGMPLEESIENPEKKQKKWTGSQTREFSDLHSLLAHLILACDMKPFRTCDIGDYDEKVPRSRLFLSSQLLKMPQQVSTLLYGSLCGLYISEAIGLCREFSSSSTDVVVDMLIQVSFCSKRSSMLVLEELMRQYNSVSSSELRNLSQILVEVMCISDPVQRERLVLAVMGSKELGIDGLLDLIQNNQNTDSCRAYQAIKCLVTASSRCPAVKDHLIMEPTRWQWAVNWLKSKMESNFWSPSSDSVLSNEDSTTRTFHRTTSAQVTLDEANAMLAEFDADFPMETDDIKKDEEVEDH